MKIGIVGGGILGLSLGHYLQRQGHQIEILERNEYLGGLACSFDYGPFVWDRFYHVILPQDAHLLGLLDDLGLSDELRWRPTQTGFYSGGAFYPMSNARQMLQFPLLGWFDKLRMGLATLYAVRMADVSDLHRMTAAAWLTKVFGASNYKQFWRPLLRAKFGVYADTIAAATIQTALQRLFSARSTVAHRESMGYVHGGYDRIVKSLRERLERRGACIHLGASIRYIGHADEMTPDNPVFARMTDRGDREQAGAPSRCSIPRSPAAVNEPVLVDFSTCRGASAIHSYDKVVFTAPQQAAWPILSGALKSTTAISGPDSGTAKTYLGVVSLNMVLRQPLTPYYVLNISDGSLPLTGMVEVTGLIDREEETAGLSLVYLPRYLDSQDPFLDADDRSVYDELFTNGLKRLFVGLTPADVVSWHVQRARHVQPLQFATRAAPPTGNRLPDVSSSFILANTACLAYPTLNNNEVIGFAKEVALLF